VPDPLEVGSARLSSPPWSSIEGWSRVTALALVAISRGSPLPPSTTAQSSPAGRGVRGDGSRAAIPAPGTQPKQAPLPPRSGTSKASTAARSPIPNGASRSRMFVRREAPREGRGEQLSRQAALGLTGDSLHASVRGDHKSPPVWTQSRSKSPSSPERADHDQPRFRRHPAPRRDRMRQAPAAQIRLRRHEWAAPGTPHAASSRTASRR